MPNCANGAERRLRHLLLFTLAACREARPLDQDDSETWRRQSLTRFISRVSCFGPLQHMFWKGQNHVPRCKWRALHRRRLNGGRMKMDDPIALFKEKVCNVVVYFSGPCPNAIRRSPINSV